MNYFSMIFAEKWYDLTTVFSQQEYASYFQVLWISTLGPTEAEQVRESMTLHR